MGQTVIQAKNVTKVYQSANSKVVAIDQISFQVQESEFVVILGPSGAGKTTLLNLLGGMDTLTKGDLTVSDVSLKHINDKNLTNYRRNLVGFVFQFYNLIPNLTALENV